MSRRHWTIPILLSLILTTGSLRAQEVEITEEALVAHLDTLAPQLRATQKAMQELYEQREQTSRRTNLATTDTFNVGLLTVVAPVDQADLARAIYQDAWAPYTFVDRSPTLESVYFTFQWSTERQGILIEDREAVRAEYRGFVNRDEIELEIVRKIGDALRRDLEAPAIGSDRLRVEYPVTASTNRAWMYRWVAMVPAEAAGDCLDGDAMRCWSLLGHGESWREWSAPEDRPLLLGRSFLRAPVGEAERAAWRACWSGDLAECDRTFEYIEEQGRMHAPLANEGESQMSLLWIALNEGGEGAWGRLLDNHDRPAAEALVAAAGMRDEELAAKWQAYLMDSQPDPHSDVGKSGLLAIFWVLVFAGFAMRSTRWRFA